MCSCVVFSGTSEFLFFGAIEKPKTVFTGNERISFALKLDEAAFSSETDTFLGIKFEKQVRSMPKV